MDRAMSTTAERKLILLCSVSARATLIIMKLGTKLNLSIFVVVIGFFVSIGFLVVTIQSARQLQELMTATQRALLATSSSTIASQNLLTTNEPLEPAYTQYLERREQALAAMQELAAHPTLALLPAEIRNVARGSLSVWELNLEQFRRSDDNIRVILDTDLPTLVNRNGLMRMARELQDYDDQPSQALRFRILNTENTITRVVGLSAEFVTDRLGLISDAISETSRSIIDRFLLISLLVAGVMTLGGMSFMILYTRRITVRVARMAAAVNRIAERDLTVTYTDTTRDEIGALASDVQTVTKSLLVFLGSVVEAIRRADELQQTLGAANEESASALNQITRNIENIRKRFDSLNESVLGSGEAVGSIDEKIQTLRGDMSVQTENIESISSSIEQMAANVQNVARLSEERRVRADEISSTVREGSEKMEATTSTIRSVAQDVDNILEIIEIINGVSEQTHLLSMNAAIESAHAGEAGRGFAVVAEEIRKLAESTSENAGNIDRTLRDITSKISEATRSSESSMTSFEDLQTGMQDFASAMKEISESMQELALGSREVLGSTQSVREFTGRLNSSSRRMAERSTEIRQAMETVQDISTDVVNGMTEIETGAKEILTSMMETGELTEMNRSQMLKLENIVSEYRLPKIEAAAETASPDLSAAPPAEDEETGISLLNRQEGQAEPEEL
ncbi:MAG: methyl-accepting chemotaxis protein [Spirochaetaceae bacterium]|nr:MAG: methyl-accepting chemotaxis protein [Spirochaetaceae bacterium]